MHDPSKDQRGRPLARRGWNGSKPAISSMAASKSILGEERFAESSPFHPPPSQTCLRVSRAFPRSTRSSSSSKILGRCTPRKKRKRTRHVLRHSFKERRKEGRKLEWNRSSGEVFSRLIRGGEAAEGARRVGSRRRSTATRLYTWSSTDGGRHTDGEDEQTARRRARRLQNLPRRRRCRRKRVGRKG